MHPARRHFLLLAKILFLFFCLLPLLVSSQPISSVIEQEQVDIVIEKWTSENGLPYTAGTRMKKIVQDSRGFMWIYPNNSLVRFDGKHFKEYSFKPNSQEVFTNVVEDSSGNLWLIHCEEECSILVFNPRQERFYTLEAYLDAPSYPSSAFLKNPLLRIFSIQKEIFIINDFANEIWKYDGELRSVFKETPTANQSYLPAPDGLFWKMAFFLKEREEILLVDSTGKPLQTFTTPKGINHFIDANYQLWHGDYLLYDLDPSFNFQKTVRPVDPRNSAIAIPDFHATYLLPYDYHSLQSGYTLSGGLKKLTLQHKGQVVIDDVWSILEEAGFYFRTIPHSIIVSKDGSFWMTRDDHLLRIQFKEKNFTTIFKGYSVRHISAIESNHKILINGYNMAPLLVGLQTKNEQYLSVGNSHSFYSGYPYGNDIWFWNGRSEFSQLDYTTGEEKRHNTGPKGEEITDARAFHFLTDSTFLFGSHYGIHTYDHKNNQLQHIIENTPTYWIHEDQKGSLWAGTQSGLYHLPTQQYYLDSLNNEELIIQHIYETPKGGFWLSSNQGLIHWEPFGEIYQVVSTEDGLSNNTVHAAYPDKRGILWLSTNHGVSAFAPQSNRIQNFFETDGLIGNEQNYLAHCSKADGRVFFGGINGVSAFYPDSISLNIDSLFHDIYITVATLSNANQQSLEYLAPNPAGHYSLNISPSFSQISIDVALPYFDGQEVVFQWRIPGIFNKWNDIKENHITLNGLTAGRHQLALRAYCINNPTHILTKQITIHRRVFFYQQTWFWVACMIFVWVNSWLLYRWRSKRLRLQAKTLENLVDKRTTALKQQKEVIEKQNHHLEEINQAKNQLFNNISHEFRTPLSLISGYSEQLLSTLSGTEETKQPVLKIKQHTESLAEMIDEILSLQKLDSGILPLHKSSVDWIDLIKQQFGLFNGLAQKKQLVYRLEIVQNESCVVAIDQKKVIRILQNLIGNAIKYTPDRGQVIVRTKILEEELLFTVKDNGPGVPLDEQEAIFKRFYQGRAAKGSAQPGYGIGLALSAEYAKLMGAVLWIESQVNRGTTFFFRLAKEEVDSSTLIAAAPSVPVSSIEIASALSSPTSTNKKAAHILIVEDNEELLTFLTDQLGKHYQVTALTNGQLALDFLIQHQHIDLILSDVMMPVMDGKSLLKSVRKEPSLVFIPFIMLTALSDLPDRIEAFQLGVDSYLTKPFDLEELFAQVANLIHFGQARKIYRENKLLQDVPDTEQPEARIASYDEEWLRTFDIIVQKEIKRSDLKIVDLAYQLHISERTLRNKIMEYTGMSPSEYITKARLKLAYPLVKQRKYATVAEVAYASGFRNPRYFSQQFKKEFGKSPSAY